MDEIQRQVKLAKLILEQDKDDKSRHVAPEYTMRRVTKGLSRPPQAIQTINPRSLDALSVRDAAKRLDIEGPRPSGENVKDYDAECAEQWQIAVNKAKQAECQDRQATESTRTDELNQ